MYAIYRVRRSLSLSKKLTIIKEQLGEYTKKVHIDLSLSLEAQSIPYHKYSVCTHQMYYVCIIVLVYTIAVVGHSSFD